LDSIIWILLGVVSISVLIVAVLAVIWAVKMKRSNTQKSKEVDYQVFFILGISFLPVGIIFTVLSFTSDFSGALGTPFLAMGVIYIAIALGNRNKSKRNNK